MSLAWSCLVPAWVPLRFNLGPAWVLLGSLFGPSLVPLGSCLGPTWVPLWSCFDPSWVPIWFHFGPGLVPLMSRLGPAWVFVYISIEQACSSPESKDCLGINIQDEIWQLKLENNRLRLYLEHSTKLKINIKHLC